MQQGAGQQIFAACACACCSLTVGAGVYIAAVVLLRLRRYGPLYVWAQLSSWYKQTVYDPTASLSAERRGTLSLPDVEACYNTKDKYDARVSGCGVCGEGATGVGERQTVRA